LDKGTPRKSSDALAEREIVNAWQYDRWNEDVTTRRDWFNEWLQATVLIEPPDESKNITSN